MIDYLWQQLPRLAVDLIDESWRDIDDPREHEPKWHQWGILEHTRRVWQAMAQEVPIFCLAWHMPFVQALKTEFIQERPKWDLLLVACVLHDLGKWAGRKTKATGSYSFKRHEAVSEYLIRYHPQVRQTLAEVRLGLAHIDYIATVAGLHYELGKLRGLGRRRGQFDLAFLQSDLFRISCEIIFDEHPDYAREIGLIFLADSLAKVEFRQGIEDPAGIEAKIKEKGLSAELVQAVNQLPLNIALCRAYLNWLQQQERGEGR